MRLPAERPSQNEVTGARQRFSGPSQRCQCLLSVLRTLVVPLSGSIFRSSLKSNSAPLARKLVGALLGGHEQRLA
jgi:hypothetical protein